eukprot:9131213-Alexandrium_andersonii.AAC.1
MPAELRRPYHSQAVLLRVTLSVQTYRRRLLGHGRRSRHMLMAALRRLLQNVCMLLASIGRAQ